MIYPVPFRTVGSPVSERALRALQRAVAIVGRETRTEASTHIQPHAHATAKLTRHFAAAYGLQGKRLTPTLEEIELCAYMHDIGKYFIDPSILLKPGKLDEEERAVMSLHSVYGAIIIPKLPGTTEAVRRVALHHHERWDGKGYPEGLCGAAIPLEARIVSVVDVYTSLRARRSYKPALAKQEAIKFLIEMAGHELDPHIVEDFIKLIEEKQ